eukprot:gene33715-40790_t
MNGGLRPGLNKIGSKLARQVAIATTTCLLTTLPITLPSLAVSGGGKDYATKDIRGQNFDNQNLINKDFTQCDATGASFKGAKLKGSRFYRANLKEADFSNADLSGVSLEDTDLENTVFSNSVLTGAYFSASINQAKSIAGADFTDALMPEFATSTLCKRLDIQSKNPATGISTADSLMCP